jgi:hypothetical protein
MGGKVYMKKYNNIFFNIWEIHTPTTGKAHPKLVHRSDNLNRVI